MARFNKKVTNRITGPFAARLPGFAVVIHVGRVSGRRYRTPVNLFRRGDDYVFVLTYGAEADWVKNVEASGACDVETRGRTVRLLEPRLLTDPVRQPAPGPLRPILRLLGVDEFLSMRAAAMASTPARHRDGSRA